MEDEKIIFLSWHCQRTFKSCHLSLDWFQLPHVLTPFHATWSWHPKNQCRTSVILAYCPAPRSINKEVICDTNTNSNDKWTTARLKTVGTHHQSNRKNENLDHHINTQQHHHHSLNKIAFNCHDTRPTISTIVFRLLWHIKLRETEFWRRWISENVALEGVTATIVQRFIPATESQPYCS